MRSRWRPASIKGLLAGLGDPYTVYYTPDEYSSLTEETSGVYCGIGVLVSKNVQTGIVTALRVFPGSPAEEAGMQKGDIIYKVKDISAAEAELDILVQEYIRGEEGSYVDVTVLRGERGNTASYSAAYGGGCYRRAPDAAG